jgi:hypothetical protein
MTDRISIPLRIAPELHAQLKQLAARDQRSLNAFIALSLTNMVARVAPGSPVAVTSLPQRAPVPSRPKKVRPNELCPCGSGTKYKRCHGKGPEAR